MQDGITSSNQYRGLQNPSYRLRLWHHIEPVFVRAGDPNYDIRTPDMPAGHDLVLTVRSDEKGSFKMLKSRIGLALASALVIASSLIAIEPASAADGCGPGWWRGPWGHCRNTPYTGPLPRGGYQVEFRAADNGCPPGFWRGPYGHCRDTPFHGRLPNGNLQ